MSCLHCGAGLRPDDRACTRCGAPAPTPARRGPAAVALAAAVAVALLAGAGGVAWYALHGRTADAVTAGPPASAPAARAPVATPGLSRPTQGPAPRPTVDDADPAAALDAQADADRPAAEATVGFWLPQLSSKYAGLDVGGVVYDDARILGEFRAAQQQYGAILVRSGDYSTFARAGLWVVLVPERNDDADAANAWCDGQGLGADDCFAKRLSHTEGPSGNTKHRS